MADNNDAAVEDDEVETKIERLKSENPNETLFSVTFDKFQMLPTEKGQAVKSSEFSCFGSKWRVKLYPDGNKVSFDGMVSLYLERRSEGKDLEIKYSLAVCSKDGSNISQQDRSVFLWFRHR